MQRTFKQIASRGSEIIFDCRIDAANPREARTELKEKLGVENLSGVVYTITEIPVELIPEIVDARVAELLNGRPIDRSCRERAFDRESILGRSAGSARVPSMQVERLKYTIWAADKERAVQFYCDLFGGAVGRSNEAITEVEISGGIISIHDGGEGKRTWTGLTFQVPDVVAGAAEVRAAGGACPREPQPENGEPPHLAMCIDPEGNEFMLSRKRG